MASYDLRAVMYVGITFIRLHQCVPSVAREMLSQPWSPGRAEVATFTINRQAWQEGLERPFILPWSR